MAENLQIVAPPSHIFKRQGFQMEPAKGVVREMTTYLFDHMEFPESGGMLAWFVGCPFPAKGMPFPQFINALNGAKRFFKVGMDVVTSKEMFWPMMGFLVSPRKISLIEKSLDAFADGSLGILEPYLLAPERYSPCPLEIRRFLTNVLMDIGISQKVSDKFAEVFSLFIQGDDAYRLRLEDILSETSKEVLTKNPLREIMKLITILEQREPNGNRDEGNVAKFAKIGKLLKFAFFIPKFKRAFINALEKSNFKNFQLDDADKYHLMLREDYNMGGYSIEERKKMYLFWCQTFNSFPPRTTVRLRE